MLLRVHAHRDDVELLADGEARRHLSARFQQPVEHLRAEHRAPVIHRHQNGRLPGHRGAECDRLVVLVAEGQVHRHLRADLFLDARLRPIPLRFGSIVVRHDAVVVGARRARATHATPSASGRGRLTANRLARVTCGPLWDGAGRACGFAGPGVTHHRLRGPAAGVRRRRDVLRTDGRVALLLDREEFLQNRVVEVHCLVEPELVFAGGVERREPFLRDPQVFGVQLGGVTLRQLGLSHPFRAVLTELQRFRARLPGAVLRSAVVIRDALVELSLVTLGRQRVRFRVRLRVRDESEQDRDRAERQDEEQDHQERDAQDGAGVVDVRFVPRGSMTSFGGGPLEPPWSSADGARPSAD